MLAAIPALSRAEPAGDAAPAPVQQDEVGIKVVKVGPGGRTRAGDWGGVLIEFRDSALKPRDILLRLTGHDRDGDPPAYERVVVGDPERARSAWLYAELPYAETTSRVTITAHEAVESADGTGEPGYRAGRVLGRAWIDTTRLVPPESCLLGVLGSRDFGLRRYGSALQTSILCLPLGHEHTEVVSGLTIDDLPDRWQGLAPYEVVVWGRGVDPAALGPERARALMEWVRRGGHLVVVLPPVGQEWTVSARNPIAAVMPSMRIDRRENASLEPYRALLTLDPFAALPADSVVQVFTRNPDAGPIEAMPVLSGPDGACIAMRRVVGTGMVTVVGLDLAAGRLVASGTLDAEAFWHRVLGRRHSLETYEEVRARDADLASAIQQRTPADYDADIEALIDRTGDRGKGVLLGLAVFALYWLLAGPLGYILLGKYGWRAHAWTGFLAMTAAFTALAWLGATVLRPGRVEGNHLAFLDGVHGSPVQSSRVWMSVLVPSYGEARLAVGDPDSSSDDLIAPWTPPPPAGSGGGFPDNRGYSLSARRPDTMNVPVRSTIKQIRVDWCGEPAWGMPRPVRRPGDIGEPVLRLVDPEKGVVEGGVTHDLPGPLGGVLVIVVKGQRDLIVSPIGPTWRPAMANMKSPTLDLWNPGERLDLGSVTGGDKQTANDMSDLTWFDDAG
ncbi:MAG: hypothetical protein K8E66_09065, partial [Phycisphaerales bacterium]|nr:hypothetical protein [Phycisphaerales bacterium]